MVKTGWEAQAGSSLYTKLFLPVYDWSALKINLRFAWKCPSRYMLALYNENVSSNHLDIGPGTGYFLQRCQFPVSNPRVVLMDLNPNCLELSAERLKQYSPETHLHNALEPIKTDIEPFDSISIMNLLHCLPGDMSTKAIVFKHLKAALNPNGVLFGSTILGTGVPQSFMARRLQDYCNARVYMTNYKDNFDSLKRGLDECFAETSARVVGSVALFSARKQA
jgi:SAM-dependent methyltransferase